MQHYAEMNQRSSHPSVIEESIKRAQKKDVSKPLRKSFDLSVTSCPLIMRLREALKRLPLKCQNYV